LSSGRGDERPYEIVFLTDGMPTVGETSEEAIVDHVAQLKKHIRIFCFGIGNDVNTRLLDNITEESRAFSQYVLPDEDIEVKVSNFFAKIKEPVLVNPVLKFIGDIRTSKLYPAALPDLFKGEQLVLVGRYSGQGDSAISVEGTANGVSRRFTYEVKFPAEASQNDFIPRLWATRRVGYLLDEIRLHGENSELRDEVTDLARKYGIVTPYTAYLIVEDEKRRDVPQAMRSMQRLGEDESAQQAARAGFSDFRNRTSGEGAVADAIGSRELKAADASAPAAAQARNYAFGGGGGMGGGARGGAGGGGRGGAVARPLASPGAPMPPPTGRERLAQYSEQTQFVAGKNFFQNGDQWLDADIQKSLNAKRVRLQFGSSDYFDFVAKHPKAAAWLALGQNVRFLLDNTIYEIYE
jgi:Ca-activated chloride channel family protein